MLYKRAYQNLREFAEYNGWTFRVELSGYPSVAGEYRGRQFEFDTLTYTKFFMRRPRRKITFSILNSAGVKANFRGNIFSILEYSLLHSGIEVGDDSFDQQFIVKGEPKELIQELLRSDTIRKEIKKVKALVGGVSIKVSQQILICELSLFPLLGGLSKNNIMEILNILSDLADSIDNL